MNDTVTALPVLIFLQLKHLEPVTNMRITKEGKFEAFVVSEKSHSNIPYKPANQKIKF